MAREMLRHLVRLIEAPIAHGSTNGSLDGNILGVSDDGNTLGSSDKSTNGLSDGKKLGFSDGSRTGHLAQ
eukprot:scaffold1755_cov214-Chaetoceros_neogracile.AAC.1